MFCFHLNVCSMHSQLEGEASTYVNSYTDLRFPLLHLFPLGDFPYIPWAPFSGPSGRKDGVLLVFSFPHLCSCMWLDLPSGRRHRREIDIFFELWVSSHTPQHGAPLCGSSIQTDRFSLWILEIHLPPLPSPQCSAPKGLVSGQGRGWKIHF